MIINVIYNQNYYGLRFHCREALQVKTDHIADKAKAKRDLMIKVEKAAAEHSKAGAKAWACGGFGETESAQKKQYDQYGYVCIYIYTYIYNININV